MLDTALERMKYRARKIQEREQFKRDLDYYNSIDWDAHYKATADYEKYIKEHHAEIAHDILYGDSSVAL